MPSQNAKPKQNREETMNWADYVDALARGGNPDTGTEHRPTGRRLRDPHPEDDTLTTEAPRQT